MNNISFIDIIEENGEFVKAVVNHINGIKTEVVGKDEVVKAVIDFSMQTGVYYEDLLNDSEKINVTKVVSPIEETAVPEPVVPVEETSDDDTPILEDDEEIPAFVPELTDESTPVTPPREEEVEFEEETPSLTPATVPIVPSLREKKRNLKKIGAIAIVSGLVLYGGITVLKNGGFNLNRNGTPQAANVVYEDVVDANTQNPELVDGYYTVTRRDEPVEDNGSKYIENVEASHQLSDLGDKVKAVSYNKPMSRDEFIETLNRLNLDLSLNMNEVRLLIDGSRMTGDEYLLYLETLFPQGSIEYAAVKKFCGLRNNIVHNAFALQDITTTENLVRKFYQVYSNFVFNGYALDRTNDFEFADLNDMAKYIIVVLGEKVLEVNVDYSMTYMTGDNWSKQTIADQSESLFDTIETNFNSRITK